MSMMFSFAFEKGAGINTAWSAGAQEAGYCARFNCFYVQYHENNFFFLWAGHARP